MQKEVAQVQDSFGSEWKSIFAACPLFIVTIWLGNHKDTISAHFLVFSQLVKRVFLVKFYFDILLKMALFTQIKSLKSF